MQLGARPIQSNRSGIADGFWNGVSHPKPLAVIQNNPQNRVGRVGPFQEVASSQTSSDGFGHFVVRISRLAAGGFEDAEGPTHGWCESREGAEGFDELRHDFEDPPRILLDAV